MIDFLGGRKVVLGYVFLGCTTFLINAMIISGNKPDYVGMATVIAAMAAGLASVVWGNVQEHKVTAQTPAEKVQ
jgi:protein-S-isoprenylcysteine O-methyltransferase Ste14